MKSLKLNKIKISKLSDPHAIMAGLIQNGAQPTATEPVPFTYDYACLHTKDKDDADCANQTNGGNGNRTVKAPVSGVDGLGN